MLDTARLDQAAETLQAHKDEWARLPIAAKINLLKEFRKGLKKQAKRWVRLSVEAKGLTMESPWANEEWVTGPWSIGEGLRGYLATMQALERGAHPPVQEIRVRANGQLAVQVYPFNAWDNLLLNGLTAEVWQEPGITDETLYDNMASFYRQEQPRGAVCLVLGAGNINSIPVMDLLTKLFVEGQVVLLKLSPINGYLAPVIEDIFESAIDAGYLRVVNGDVDVGEYLAHHGGVDTLHLTGSSRTYETIVFGPGDEGKTRKEQGETRYSKPITSELGGVGPVIVVPGPWDDEDIQYQAERITTFKLHNAGFNCVAAQVIILPEGWDKAAALLDGVRKLMDGLPPRASYYPGAKERQEEIMREYAGAEVLCRDKGRILISGLSGDDGCNRCFQEELFGPIYAQTSVPGDTPSAFLQNAVRFSNESLYGNMGATILIHPKTQKQMGPLLEEMVGELKYGAVGVNLWSAAAFLIAEGAWGAYPGNHHTDIKSGVGFVHNTAMFDKPQKTVVRGSFYPFPRGIRHGSFALLPKPPWFVTNKTGHVTTRRIARMVIDPHWWRVPGIVLSALRG